MNDAKQLKRTIQNYYAPADPAAFWEQAIGVDLEPKDAQRASRDTARKGRVRKRRDEKDQ